MVIMFSAFRSGFRHIFKREKSRGLVISVYHLLFSVSPLGLVAGQSVPGTMAASDKPILYQHPHSYYSQKVVMTLAEKGVAYKNHIIDVFNYEHYQPWFLKLNPRAEIPVLQVSEEVIPDSSKIINYLDVNYSGGEYRKLLPTDPLLLDEVTRLRSKIDRIEANMLTFGAAIHREFVSDEGYPFSFGFIRDGLKNSEANMSVSLRKLAETRPEIRDILLKKAEEKEKAHVIIMDKEKFKEELDKVILVLTDVEKHLEKKDPEKEWLITDEFTQADVSLTILLNRLSRIGLADYLWEKLPRIGAYYARAQERDSYKQTVPTLWSDALDLAKVHLVAIILIGVFTIVAIIVAVVLIKRLR